MKLYDYIKTNTEDGDEVTVWDTAYDMETYFYHMDAPGDTWDRSMEKLQKLLAVKEVCGKGVVVDLWGLIEYNHEALIEEGLFHSGDVGRIMGNMEGIFAGHVSEEWLERFASVLKDPDRKEFHIKEITSGNVYSISGADSRILEESERACGYVDGLFYRKYDGEGTVLDEGIAYLKKDYSELSHTELLEQVFLAEKLVLPYPLDAQNYVPVEEEEFREFTKQPLRKLQKEECLKRLKMLRVIRNVICDFRKEQKLNCSEYYGALFWLSEDVKKMVRTFEKEHDAMVYHVIKSLTEFGDAYAMLYVSKYPGEWESDRLYLAEGEPYAYVVNGEVAEIGAIGVRPQIGGVFRIW